MKSRTLVLLAAISWILPICAWWATTPSSGTLTDASGPVNYEVV
jgi:hypothetical protein